MERALIDDDFVALAKRADSLKVYEFVKILNTAQQQMRFRIILVFMLKWRLFS